MQVPVAITPVDPAALPEGAMTIIIATAKVSRIVLERVTRVLGLEGHHLRGQLQFFEIRHPGGPYNLARLYIWDDAALPPDDMGERLTVEDLVVEASPEAEG